MDFKTIVSQRYAAKSFDERKVSQEKLDELLELIRLAPTSANLQPWMVMVIEDEERKQALLSSSWNQQSVTTCSHLLIFCANTNVLPLLDRLTARMREAGTPEEKVAMYDNIIKGFLESLPDPLAWAQRQTFLALAHGILGAQSLGLDSCPIEGFQPQNYFEILNLPPQLVPTVLLPIGYANDQPYPKVRFTKEEMFFSKV